MDLRRRVAEGVDTKEDSLRQLARCFCVSVTFIPRLLGLRRQTGSLAPRPHQGGRPLRTTGASDEWCAGIRNGPLIAWLES